MDEETQLLIDEFPALEVEIRRANAAGKSAGEIADSISLRAKKYMAYTGASREETARLLKTRRPEKPVQVEPGVEIPPTSSPEAAAATPQPTSLSFLEPAPIKQLGEAIKTQAGTQSGETSVAELLEQGTKRLGRGFVVPTQIMIDEIKDAVMKLPQALMTAPSFIGRGIGEFFDVLKERQQLPKSDQPFLGLTPIQSTKRVL